MTIEEFLARVMPAAEVIERRAEERHAEALKNWAARLARKTARAKTAAE